MPQFKFEKPICYIVGGETTVEVNGNGMGGRNQEVALACALEIEGLKNVCVAPLATDGRMGLRMQLVRLLLVIHYHKPNRSVLILRISGKQR